MSFIFKSLLILLISISLASCGKKRVTSKTSIQIFDSAAVTGISQVGGVMIFGHRLDDFQSFSVGIPGGTGNVELNLEQGIWEFYAIGWDGIGNAYTNKNLTGENRCGYVGNVDLNTPDKVLNINISKTNCTLNLPGGEVVNNSNFFDTTNFRQISLKSCIALPGSASATSCDYGTPEDGLTLSYRVVIKGGMKINDSPIGTLPNLTSECIDALLQDDSGENSHIRLPVGSAGDSIVSPLIIAYPETGCGGSPIFYDFKNGLIQGISSENKLTSLHHSVSSYTNKALLFIEHNPETVNEAGHYNPFGNGSDGIVVFAGSVPTFTFESTRVTGIQSNSKIIDVTLSSNFQVGDEVMMYVNEEGGTGCGTNSFTPGLFSFHHIKSIPTGTSIELFNPFNEIKTNSGTQLLPLPTDLGSTVNGTNWCSVQVMRVPNFESVDVTGATTINVLPFSDSSAYGGINVMRVKEDLRMTNALTIVGTAAGMPFQKVPLYTTCMNNNWPCLEMGAGAASGAVGTGGGSVVIIAHTVEMVSADLNITSNGQANTSAADKGANGGHIILQANNINLAAGKILTIQTDGLSGSGGGNGGTSVLKYCLAQSTISGTTLHTSIAGSGTTNGDPGLIPYEDNFCP